MMRNIVRMGCFLLLLGIAHNSVLAQSKHSKSKSTQKQKSTKSATTVKKQETLTLSADTSAPKVVNITSAFKPYLKDAVKVNFNAATPVIDSSKIPVNYIIPSQNLFFSYQPVAIKPLALGVDSTIPWKNDQYIKLGAGNLNSFLGEAGFTFGDGKHSITNIKGNFITATGKLPAQQATRWGVDVVSVFNTENNNDWTAHPYFHSTTQYQYGYQPASLNYQKDQLLQRYNTIGMEAGVQNKLVSNLGITYHPQIHFVNFRDTREDQETQFIVKAPIRKSFGKIYAINLDLGADLSTPNIPLIPNPYNFKNNIFYVNPAVQFTTPNMKLNLGIRPSWDNQTFSTLPDLTVEAKIPDANFILEAGWTGHFQKNTLRTLTDFNPWVGTLTNLLNTKISEQYAGFKGSSGEHFTYQARVSFQKLNNQALFVNNVLDGKTFAVLFEPEMKALKIHGEVGYTFQETVSVMAGATFTQYSSLTVNEKAWGLVPLEATGSIKWKLMKDLQVKADLYLSDGNPYSINSGVAIPMKTGSYADLNLGAEFSVLPKLNIWLQMNNLLNSGYQRWNQYPVMGTQVLAGVVYSFR